MKRLFHAPLSVLGSRPFETFTIATYQVLIYNHDWIYATGRFKPDIVGLGKKQDLLQKCLNSFKTINKNTDFPPHEIAQSGRRFIP